MISKYYWTMIICLLPLPGIGGVQCNSSSWNDNLNQFKRLESNYNQHVKVFNALLNEHNQRKLLSQTFSTDELRILWRTEYNQKLFQNQLETSIQYKNELTVKAGDLLKLSAESQSMTSKWKKLAQRCKHNEQTANQITAEWYTENSQQLSKDYTSLSSQFLGLAKLYDKESNTLQHAQDADR